MKRLRIKETSLDRAISSWVMRQASPVVEEPNQLLTLAGDENILIAAALGIWAAIHTTRSRRRDANHLLLCVLTTAALPHILKRLLCRERPEHQMVHSSSRGIPKSGSPYDSFPSGHATHLGAIASALSFSFPRAAPAIWANAILLSATRVILLAHWFTDVLAGLLTGAAVERALRPLSFSPPVAKARPAGVQKSDMQKRDVKEIG
ncbi:MAG TPA: phosphatase PAP2 family protein [Gemmataceae bacterium]|nr:phosphatase PAP2 family protein [Gemmataceae bacterium]